MNSLLWQEPDMAKTKLQNSNGILKAKSGSVSDASKLRIT